MLSFYRSLLTRLAFPCRISSGFVSSVCLLLPAGTVWAQAPTITSVVPAANARAAARTGPVTVTFSQTLTPASASALKVFSRQRGGLRTTVTPAVVSGNTLSFTPAPYAFLPGEVVQATVTTAASAGSPLAAPRVLEFTTAVAGTGRGNFGAGSTAALATGGSPPSVALGDVDSDGDLDAVLPNLLLNSASVALNDGTGTFVASAANATVATGTMPYGLVLGDIDGDGDLDFVTANYGSGAGSSVRMNNGSGVFTAPAVGAEVAVQNPQRALALADVDGDGDLDLLTGSSIRLNNGAGLFTAPTANAEVAGVSSGSPAFGVGDLDNDGALDLINAGTSSAGGKVDFRFNNGAGAFTARTTVPSLALSDDPRALTLGDIDADGDLDLVIGYNISLGTVSVFVNNGAGVFGVETRVAVGTSGGIRSVALADVDADGDLDLLVPAISGGMVSVRVNNGSGVFSAPVANAEIAAGSNPLSVTLGDLDADGDVDFVVCATSSITSRLNQPLILAATAAQAGPVFSAYPNPAHSVVKVTSVVPYATLEVLDALGRRVATATADANGAAQLAWPTGLVPGVYLVRAGAQVQRLLVE
ncbi:MAG: FG-GAP-like repeat-containing protein [Janthinobacterium lividum]